MRGVRVLTHIKKLDDCFGQFLVRVICECGACGEVQHAVLAARARLPRSGLVLDTGAAAKN